MSMTNEQEQTILKAIQESNNKQTEDLKDYINKELREIKEEISTERKRVTNLEEEHEELKRKYQILEKSLRKNNIIIFGLEYSTGNLLEHALNKLNNYLQLNLTSGDINNIHTVGKEQENKPVIIKFTTFTQKQNVLKNCYKLKGTSIRISEDHCVTEREEIRELKKHLKIARSKNLKAYIKGTKLYVNGKQYTSEELTNAEEFNNLHVAIEVENGNGAVETPLETQGPSLSEQQKKKKKTGAAITKTITLRSGQSSTTSGKKH